MVDRNYSVDFIRSVAILAVVIIHVSTAFLDRIPPFTIPFDIVLIINQFSRFAVPLFFAISGYMLALKYTGAFSKTMFYKKRILRILPPYLFWIIIYFFIVFPHPGVSPFSKTFFDSILTGNASYQLYFIPAIIVLYFLFPFIIKYKNLVLSKGTLLILFIITSILLMYIYYGNFNLPFHTAFRGAFYNLLPFVIGIYAALNRSKISKHASKHTLAIFLSTFALGLFVFLETFALFKTFDESRFLREQWRVSVVLYSLLCGLFFKKTYDLFLYKFKKQIFILSTLSFGVFFIHVAVLKYFLEYGVDPLNSYNLLGFFVTLIGVVVLSFTITWILSKIPKIGKTMSAT